MPGDELAVATVHVRSWQAAYRGIMPDAELDGLRPADRAARYTFGATDPGSPRTVVAVDGTDPGSVLGFATVGPARGAGVEGAGELMALYADPDCWGRRVGLALVTDARDRLAAAGYREAVLWVLEANARGRGFYARDGWAADGGADGFEVGGVTLPEIRLRRPLGP
ncbi:MAG TPA: GNAT family N-acetyltransferase [Acidimicrobiales bacterium]|nr:GNAT family N-acetyltransferase [Acidimicrobiales bacterium]